MFSELVSFSLEFIFSVEKFEVDMASFTLGTESSHF